MSKKTKYLIFVSLLYLLVGVLMLLRYGTDIVVSQVLYIVLLGLPFLFPSLAKKLDM